MSFGNTSGQVAVELRLVMDQLRKDIKSAGELLRASLGGSMDQAGSGVEKVTKKVGDLEKQTRKTKGSFDDLKRSMEDAWRKSLPPPKITIADVGGYTPTIGHVGQKFTNLGDKVTTAAIANWQQSMREYHRAGGIRAGTTPISAPPKNPPPGFTPLMGGGITYGGGWGPGGGSGGSAGAGGGFGGGRLMYAAQLGAVAAGLRATLGLVQWSFEKLLSPLRAMNSAAEAASRIWVKAAQTGNLGFTVNKSVLSRVMGVSEDEVFRYAGAVQFLNQRLRDSMTTLRDTTVPLTELSWSYKSMTTDISALASKITTVFVPSLKEAQNAIGQGAVSLTKHIDDFMRNQKAVTFAQQHGLESVTTRIPNPEGKTSREVLVGFRRLLMDGAADPKSGVFMKMFEKSLSDAQAKSPAALGQNGNSNRMAISAWERMGLIAGPSPGMDAARETARNTRKMVWLLEQIMGSGANGAPRGGFGSTPMTSAP